MRPLIFIRPFQISDSNSFLKTPPSAALLQYWWEPDSLIETYRGTEYEFIPIHLPSPTTECEEHRVSEEERCSDNFTEQVGSPLGSCDAGPVSSVILTTLGECELDEVASCSPAYSALQSYELTNLNLQQIYKYRSNNPDSDGRLAVCRWFAENLDAFKQRVVPKTYPRQRRDEAYWQPLTYFSTSLALSCMITIFICAFLCKRFEKTKVMVSLCILLACLLLYSILTQISPSISEICTGRFPTNHPCWALPRVGCCSAPKHSSFKGSVRF